MITIHSDDFGYKKYSDTKIIQLLRKGKIKSVSVLINMSDTHSLNSLANLAKTKKDLKIGLHLNLVEGKSVLEKAYIPTLVDNKSTFYPLKKFIFNLFSGAISPEHIEKELLAQIKKMKQYGLRVSFIDSHQHLHAISPIAELVEKLSVEKNISNIRSYNRIKTYTLIAKIKYLLLKTAAIISHLIIFRSLALPVSWKLESALWTTIMSWEGESFDMSKVKDKNLVFVTHPYLPFDTNRSYTWYIF